MVLELAIISIFLIMILEGREEVTNKYFGLPREI